MGVSPELDNSVLQRGMQNQQDDIQNMQSAYKEPAIYRKAELIGALMMTSGALVVGSGMGVLSVGLFGDEALKEFFNIYGPSVTSDALLGLGCIALSVGFAILTPKLTLPEIKKNASNNDTPDIWGYWGRLFILLASSAILSAVVAVARDHIGMPRLNEFGIWGVAGIQAAFIGAVVGLYKGIGFAVDYNGYKRIDDKRVGLSVAQFAVSWLLTTTLCTVASMLTPLMKPLVVSAAIGVIDTAMVLLVLTLEYNINNAIEQVCKKQWEAARYAT